MKISIITICFNAATDLENTIASVRSQKYKDYEYIVVDGGSKDATLAVINDNSDKITKWVSEPDKGIYDAMNKGIKMASGEWVIMMNAGDVFADSQVLQNVFSHAIPDSITFLYGDILIRQKDGSLLRRVMSWQNGNVNHQAVIYRRRLHDEHGLYIVTKKIIVSDYLFFVRIPEEQVQKIDLAISINDTNGISTQGNWARQQALCADVVFRRRPFWGMVRFYVWKQIKGFLPTSFKDNVKLIIGLQKNMSDNIKVSVIMPVYNSGEYLKTAVNSILSQSLKEIELILVDDGSTDGSSERCDEYAKRDSRVVVIHQKNGGICNARNTALKIAKGEYVGFSDHDDEYVPGLLEDCFEKAKNSNADVVKFVKKEYILKNNHLVREKRDYLIDAVYTQQTIRDSFFELFDRGAFTCVWDGLIKRATLEQSGILFDTSFKKGSEDIDFMLRLAPYIKIMVTMSKCYYRHYIRRGFSTSSKFNIEVVEAKKKLPQTLVEVCNVMGIDVFGQRDAYTFYLMKEYFNYVFALYANPSCTIPFFEKIRLIKNLVKVPYVPAYFIHQSVGSIWCKSKKLGLAYFLYKYHLYVLLYLMYNIRLKLS